ncbi:hypothetical protein [Vibrio harveyi]|uniref:hypothetical protein n=1 Tax=Vibrio harveyi TaxID=669 RepID=UPI000360D45A|nr:hypothetical protein [Vibrio harveyi]
MNKRDVIYQCSIGGREFYAAAGYRGLMIFEKCRTPSLSAEIGNALIAFLHTDNSPRRNKRGYHLCRYDDENVIDLTELTEDEVKEFAKNFGLPVERDGEWFSGAELDYFVGSPCQSAVIEWVKKHPKLAKQPTCHVYQLTLEDYANRS